MPRFLLALARRYWLAPFVAFALGLALWVESSYTPQVPSLPGAPGAREALINQSVALALCLLAAAIGIPGALWLRARRASIKRWLLEPFRRWAGLDEGGKTRP